MNNENTDKPVVQTNKTVNGRPLLRASIKRGEDGLKIELSSPVDWSVFANKTKGLIKLGGIDCYTPRGNDIAESLSSVGVRGYFATDPNFMYENYPNLTLLLAKDMAKGVTFNFGLVPIPDSKLESFIAALKEQVKTIYLAYMKPIERTIIINTQTIESDRHD